MGEFKNVILHGDVVECLRQLPDNYVHTVVTSPPYWGLRDYGADGQIGLEKTPEEYVEKLVDVFREVKRVLRDDGTLWLNLGDSYAMKFGGGKGKKSGTTKAAIDEIEKPPREIPSGLKPKDLVGIPWRVAFALQADGWYLRSDIIWHKPNAMPESVKDRPTKAHEYIFLLSKSPRYYYDADAIREPMVKGDANSGAKNYRRINGVEFRDDSTQSRKDNPLGRNKRTVWTVSTKPFRDAHFAVFPPDLIEPCILAGSPEKACPHCGAPWERVTKRGGPIKTVGKPVKIHNAQGTHGKTSVFNTGYIVERITVGWKPTCQCEGNDGSGRGIVLDPFFGAGTTGLVALKHNRNFIGVELNRDYVEMAKRRIESEYEGFRVSIVRG